MCRHLWLFCIVSIVFAAAAYADDGIIAYFPAPKAAPTDGVPAAPAATPVVANPAPVALSDAAPSSPPRWYAALSGSLVYLQKTKPDSGISNDHISYDFGYGYAIAGGYYVVPDVRLELEVGGSESTVKHDPFYTPRPGYVERPSETTAIMTNVYYDLHTGSPFVPYAGAGIGESYVRIPRYYDEGGVISKPNAWAMAYQLMTGVSYEFTDSFAMNVGYRYFSGPDVRGSINNTDIAYANTSHQIEAGIRWSFE